MKRKSWLVWSLLGAAAIVVTAATIGLYLENRRLDQKIDTQFELYRAEVQQKQLDQVKDFTTKQLEQKTELENQIKKLQGDLQSKANAATQNALIAKVVPQAQAAQNTSQDGSESAKMWIYMRESGNNPLARNASGCLGLGQACPGSKLTAVCPNLDYACEDSFFTRYMQNRYGTWDNAKAFWLAHSWW